MQSEKAFGKEFGSFGFGFQLKSFGQRLSVKCFRNMHSAQTFAPCIRLRLSKMALRPCILSQPGSRRGDQKFVLKIFR